MSETDNSDILEDIRALDEVLALHRDAKAESVHNRSRCSSSYGDSLTDSEYNSDEVLDIDESQDACEINRSLIKGLMIAKKQLTTLLQECERKIEQLDEKMKTRLDESFLNPKVMIICAGIPYFKDKNCFGAPKNNDTKLKESRGELFLLSLAKPCRWSAKDRETLLKAIYNEAIDSVLSREFSEEINEGSVAGTSASGSKKTTAVLPRNFAEMVGALGERDFDWYKIAVTDFDNKHSAGECRAMWNVYLHPDIRKIEWTSLEDKKLLRYAKECKYQNWDLITKKLSTRRSAYQCFIRYNTIKKVPYSGRHWNKQEDKHLVTVMNRLKMGDYIPWAEVASYLKHRTKQQVYARWTYRKAPHLKKGRFSDTETETLLTAIRQYGTDFSRISSTVMQHRTSVQLSEHYQALITSQHGNAWSINDDVKLICLRKKYGNNWSKIAKHIFSKTRTQVRHRYSALVKYAIRGVSIESLPRQFDDSNTSASNELTYYNRSTSDSEQSELESIHISDVKLRLFETLSLPPITESTSSAKELYNPEQVTCNTKKLYNILNLLDVNLDIPENFLDYIHLTRKEKQLSVSLKEYLDSSRNQRHDHETIEKVRLQMFGPISEISETSHFIPPLPSQGYIRTKKVKAAESIDCDFDGNEKFLIEAPTELLPSRETDSFLSIEEETQFYKFSKLLISPYSYQYFDRKNVNLLKSVNSKIFFDKTSTESLSKYDKSGSKSKKIEKRYETEIKQPDHLQTTVNTNKNNDSNVLDNVLLPNHATLLGFKNLLLWKLLYESQNDFSPKMQNTEQEKSPEYQKAYDRLRTRFLQLFKFPIGLSNTILEINNSETIFSKLEEQDLIKTLLKKKSQDKDSTSPIKKRKSNVLADSNNHQNVNINHSAMRSKTIRKKSKVVIK